MLRDSAPPPLPVVGRTGVPLVGALVLSAMLCLARPVTSQAPARKATTFALGDSRETVRLAQGQPAVIERLPSLGTEMWSWRSAMVRFDPASGRVVGWEDPARELRVRVVGGGAPTANRQLVLGSSAADVLRLLGRPAAAQRSGGIERWVYGRSFVAFDPATWAMTAWDDADRRLPIANRDGRDRAQVATGARARQHGAPDDRGIPRLEMTVTLRDTAVAARMAGRANVLLLTITNRGTGTAYTVEPYALIAPSGGVAAHVVWADAVASIAPGVTLTRATAVRFPTSLLSDRVVLLAGAREQNGHGVTPEVRLELPVVPSKAPRLALVAIEQEDQSGDGRASPREVVDVLVRLANVGEGYLSGAGATLSLGRDVFAAPGTPARLSLPRVQPGDTADVRFSVSTAARAESIAIRVVIRDGAGREVTSFGVPLRMSGRPDADGAASPVSVPLPSSDATDVDARLPSRATVNPDALAVIFGIDFYRTLPRARFAARDASTMRTYVTDAFGVPDDADHVLLRQDGDATQGEFRRAFGETGWLSRRVRPQSDVVVYFAGHGAADKDGAPLMLPFDADANYLRETAVQLTEVYRALARLQARRIIVVIDACFSGVSRGVSLTDGARPIVVSIEHPALLRNGMAVFAAAQGAQSANDLPDKRHGLFSYQFFRALRGAADADADGSLTVDEVDAFVSRETRAAAARRDREQHPLVIARERSLVVTRAPAGSVKR